MSTSAPQEAPPDAFLDDFMELFNSPKHSDVTLYLGEEGAKFHAHYALLSVRTEYFDPAKSHGFEEGKLNEFRLAFHSPHALYRMLQYVYSAEYRSKDGQLQCSADEDRDLLKHVRVYAAADYYQINTLKAICVKKFTEQVSRLWISDTLVPCIREIYSSTTSSSDPMRKAVVQCVSKNVQALKEEDVFQKVLVDVAEFTTELLNLTLAWKPAKKTAESKESS